MKVMHHSHGPEDIDGEHFLDSRNVSVDYRHSVAYVVSVVRGLMLEIKSLEQIPLPFVRYMLVFVL